MSLRPCSQSTRIWPRCSASRRWKRTDSSHAPTPVPMFNWVSFPTFAAMVLFWMLAAYILTRSPRSAVSATAVGAQVATAAYLMGQGMMANASTLAEWQPWARNLHWGATVGPALWYWLTTLLLVEQDAPQARTYLRRVALPLGVLLAVVSV